MPTPSRTSRPTPSTSPPPSRSRRAASIPAPEPKAPSPPTASPRLRCTRTVAPRPCSPRPTPSCKLPWNLVAAIGRVESNHGRSNGNTLSAEGLAQPGIYGAPLNGNGVAKISDTDNGALDKDTVWDRAVGPMQFIPGTWTNVGVDSDNDGKKNPQDIDDAATAAGIYLCAGSDDLSTDGGARSAVHRYNHSNSYVDLVMKISAAYAAGDFSQSPDGYPSSAIITSTSNDQTLTPKQRTEAKKNQQQAENPDRRRQTADGSTGGGPTGTGGTAAPAAPAAAAPAAPGGGTPSPPGRGGGGGGDPSAARLAYDRRTANALPYTLKPVAARTCMDGSAD